MVAVRGKGEIQGGQSVSLRPSSQEARVGVGQRVM